MIDDEEGIRRALLRLLRSAGQEAHAFISGKSFLDSLQTRQPGCVLLDLHMPDMSGFAVIKRLQQIAPALPVIVLTGQDISEKQKTDYLAHAHALLRKPVDDANLFETIATALTESSNNIP